MRYFMLEPDLRGKVLALLKQRADAHRNRWAFCLVHGADAVVSYGSDRWYLTFPEDQPCPKGWKRLKEANKAIPSTHKLRDKMKSEKYFAPGGHEVAGVLGIETMFGDIYRTPSVDAFDDDCVVVGVDDSIDHIPGARRISDLDYEGLVASQRGTGDS